MAAVLAWNAYYRSWPIQVSEGAICELPFWSQVRVLPPLPESL